jgi:hypothetical protein
VEDEKKSVILYLEWGDMLNGRPLEEKGELLEAILLYSRSGKPPTFRFPFVSGVFAAIRPRLDENAARWEDTRKKRQDAGRRGGSTRASCAKPVENCQAKLSNAKQSQAKQAVYVNVNDNVLAAEAANEGRPPPLPEQFFTENGFGPASYAPQALQAYRAKGCSDDLLLRCMQEALDCGNPRWNYTKAILDRCLREQIGTAAAFDESRRLNGSRGGGLNVRVDRSEPSGNDFLKDAADRTRRLKRRD